MLDLFDSVYRGFPVGDLLLFKRAAEAAAIHVGPLHVHAEAVPEAYFVVDGQQRITALAGAMLHPEPRPYGDIYAAWFDLEEERFVRPFWDPLPEWIPLNVVGDSFALLTWLNEWPFRSQRPDLVQRAIGLGKALREYQLPAYIVEGASDEVLRLIFKRVNTSGVAMLESEIFTTLFGGGEPRPLESASARLHTATGFGVIPLDLLLQCPKVVEGLDVNKKVTERQVLELDPFAVERTENALLHALRFLLDDAGVLHFQLLPDASSLITLTVFFHAHPRPAQRTRALLARWLWRGAFRCLDPDALSIIDGDEFATVDRLLQSRASAPFAGSAATSWEYPETEFEQLCALAIAHLGPRDPETGAVLGTDEIRALLDEKPIGKVFLDVGRRTDSTVAGRVLVSSRHKLEKLPSASLPILESHGLDQEAADALGRGDIDTFVARRTPILDRWFQRFFAARIGADDGDRPPIAELIRRADAAFSAP